ncbi:MAG: TolC family protein [Phycisphaerales bacterium]|nr:MAG: TolC family protein [Phycisphaerales bacterium]
MASEEAPQRTDNEGADAAEPLGLLTPVSSESELIPEFDVVVDPNTGSKISQLTVEQAIFRALAHSPEIRVVSFDPAIAQQELTQATAEFDPTVFSRLNYEDEDNPENSIFTPGQSETTLFESGLKQRISTGAEWSASYALTRIWDNLVGRTLPTRYEPVLAFQLKQPLLRDAGQKVNLAGVDIARLNHRIALLGFRKKAEEISTEVIRAYWQLVQARRDLEIQRRLVKQTEQTVDKVEGRRGIDATGVHVHQAKSYAKSSQAVLLNFEKRVNDAQDALVRLMATSGVHLASDVEIVPVTAPEANEEEIQRPVADRQALALAMQHNPIILHAKAAVEIADINVRVAKHQRMPRLDLVTSASTQGLAREREDASGQLGSDYTSYAAGLVFEFTLGGRERYAELIKRRLERRKATAVLHNVADQVAVQVKERLRKVETNLAEIQVQTEAVAEGSVYLQALQDSEMVREQLTAEFLLVKLQAQETLAQAERAENEAMAQFNIALAELAQATGTVLDLHPIETSLSSLVTAHEEAERERQEIDRQESEAAGRGYRGYLWPLPGGRGTAF